MFFAHAAPARFRRLKRCDGTSNWRCCLVLEHPDCGWSYDSYAFISLVFISSEFGKLDLIVLYHYQILLTENRECEEMEGIR